jgi:N-acetylglucosaminyldiphosphoundecaprenol N-acetyl-beta-D-mannosaminyltransferase
MAKILDVRVDDFSKVEALGRSRGFLRSGGQHAIYTPNPEMLVAAHRDHAFRDILNKGDLNICDGRGIQLFGGIRYRIPGVEFMQELCEVAGKEKKTVYLLGSSSDEILKKVKNKLKEVYPKLEIVGFSTGPLLDKKGLGDSDETIKNINSTNPDILFVAFGHGKQEYWIDQNLQKFPCVKIAMGVGGSFDFISGNKKRAPRCMRKMGMEWLWRLLVEPKRIKRIINAIIVFPYFIFKSKI